MLRNAEDYGMIPGNNHGGRNGRMAAERKRVKGVRVFLYLLYPEKVNTGERRNRNHTWENTIIVYFISKSEV